MPEIFECEIIASILRDQLNNPEELMTFLPHLAIQ